MVDSNPNQKSKTIAENTHTQKESITTMNFNRLDNSSLQFTIENLNAKNYREWVQSVKLIINRKGKMGYLIRETKKSTSTNTSAM